MKPAPMPIIDLCGYLKVIDDTGKKPMWITLCRLVPASIENAKRELRNRKLTGGWIITDTGDKEYVTV